MTANIRIDTIIHKVKICEYKCNYGYGVDINADMRCDMNTDMGCRCVNEMQMWNNASANGST